MTEPRKDRGSLPSANPVRQWVEDVFIDLARQFRWSYLPPLMVYLAAGISGLTAIVGAFFVKDYLGLSAVFLAGLAFWAGIPWALKMPLGHLVDLIWRWKALLVYLGAEAAIMRISEVNQIANTRISTAAQIAAAKTLSDAEITSASLSALTHARLKYLYKSAINTDATADELSQSLNNVGENAATEINNYARNVIDKLQMNAADAIGQIKINSENALTDINKLIETIDLDIDSNKKKAEKRLEKLKNLQRTTERVQEDADQANRVIYKQFEEFSKRVNARCSNAMTEIEQSTNIAISTISESVKKANARIFEMQNKCLNTIKIMLQRTLYY